MSSSRTLNAAIVIISDTVSKDVSSDKSYAALNGVFQEQTNVQWNVAGVQFLPDEKDMIEAVITKLCSPDSEDGNKVNLIVTTGGTGFAARDVTPEAIEPLLERKAPGLV